MSQTGTIYQNDRDRNVQFVFSVVDPASINDARLIIERPDGTEAEWSVDSAIADLGASTYSATHRLATDGSDVDLAGTYRVRAWFYGGEPTEVIETSKAGKFLVRPEVVEWPE